MYFSLSYTHPLASNDATEGREYDYLKNSMKMSISFSGKVSCYFNRGLSAWEPVLISMNSVASGLFLVMLTWRKFLQ